MRIRYPSSFLKLLLIGFACASLPLLWAFGNAYFAFDKLSQQSQQNTQRAVASTRAGHALLTHINHMERSAKQFFVLQDIAFFNHYQSAYQAFNQALTQLNSPANGSLAARISEMRQLSQTLHAQILQAKQANIATTDFLDQFSLLAEKANALIEQNNQNIDATSTKLERYAHLKQRQLFLQSLVLIPLALAVSGIIAWLLIRPIRRMDAVITRLGGGDYDTPIDIDGPGNLRLLGQRLNWLRHGLKEINAQKQQFLQQVSHDLKTPLTAIREASGLLLDDVGGKLTTQQHEIVLILRQNSIKLQGMIDNLLHFTQQSAMPAKIEWQAIPIAALVRQVLDAHILTIRGKSLEIHTQFAHAILHADKEKMRLVLDNLISNACKYTPPNGQIWVHYQLIDGMQILEVMDNGQGLAGLDASRLFEPFYKSEHAEQTLSSTGLGLAIVKQLVELHGGSVTVAAPKPDMGAHFTLRLPLPSSSKKFAKGFFTRD